MRAPETTKKALGQHWLKDLSILEAISECADVQKGDKVLEIGPGLGTLTDVLVSAGADVVALEFDEDLIASLNAKYNSVDSVTIEHGDVRSYDFRKLPVGYKVVANIPYYLTSHLVRSLSETENPPEVAVLLIQKEVAQRICAEPGQMSILAVTAQFYFECDLDVEVPAHYFTPPPKVDSQVVRLTRRSSLLLQDEDEIKDFFRIVKAGFSNKRKTLVNSLSAGLHVEKDEVRPLLESADVGLMQRPQELSTEQWMKIYKIYTK